MDESIRDMVEELRMPGATRKIMTFTTGTQGLNGGWKGSAGFQPGLYTNDRTTIDPFLHRPEDHNYSSGLTTL